MLDSIDTIQNENNTRTEIYLDDNPESPREWSNLGTMVCWHSRYNLGDDHDYKNPYHCLLDLASKGLTYKDSDLGDEYAYDDLSLPEKLSEKVWKYINSHYVILPLHLYDHSGITMSTSSFRDGWDSGQVGYIFVSFDTLREECADRDKKGNLKSWKYITSARKKRAIQNLKSEVETYDQYLTGDVYGFKDFCNVCDEELDSVWGFFGSNWKENGLLESAGGDCPNCKDTEENLQLAFDFLEVSD